MDFLDFDWKKMEKQSESNCCTLWHCDHKDCPGKCDEKNELCKECIDDFNDSVQDVCDIF